MWYNEGAVAGSTAARVVVKALDVVIMLERQGFLFTPSPGRSFVISAFISRIAPQGAGDDILTKYNVARSLETTRA